MSGLLIKRNSIIPVEWVCDRLDLPSADTKCGWRRKGPFRVVSEGGVCSPTFPSPRGVTPSPGGQLPAPHFLFLAGEGLAARVAQKPREPAVRAAGLAGSTPDPAGWGSPCSCWGVMGFVSGGHLSGPPRQVPRWTEQLSSPPSTGLSLSAVPPARPSPAGRTGWGQGALGPGQLGCR